MSGKCYVIFKKNTGTYFKNRSRYLDESLLNACQFLIFGYGRRLWRRSEVK